ncbi:MAG TPA: sigma-70 family RNA polymerase sigma factor, partial [Acidimicrobiales bacterium]|nr:sigma-70 family RNA polymerase sigma factor [Acidimicrobiales bacterium]
MPSEAADDPVVRAVAAGDQSAFAQVVERHRRELHVHCYRMLGSFEDAEDPVQETFLRAWLKRASFEGRSTLRAWLYRIATNSCLEVIRRHPRPVPLPPASGSWRPPYSELPWLEPYPDSLLDAPASVDEGPDALVVARETIALAFLASIQLLPPKQRAVLILRDVVRFSA